MWDQATDYHARTMASQGSETFGVDHGNRAERSPGSDVASGAQQNNGALIGIPHWGMRALLNEIGNRPPLSAEGGVDADSHSTGMRRDTQEGFEWVQPR